MEFNHGRISGNLVRAIVFFMIAIAAVSTALYATHQLHLTHDSMSYALVSQEIVSGRGIRTPVTLFQGVSPDSEGTVPFVVQPPLLPLLLALLGAVKPGILWPGQVLNVLSHIITAVFCGLIAERLRGTIIGIVTGITVAFAWPLLMVSYVLWSESLFIALTVMSIWFLQMSRYAKRQKLALCGAGILAGAAIATRFAGIALLPLFLWEVFSRYKSKKQKSVFVFGVLAFLIPVAIGAILLVRNYVLSGAIRGYEEPEQARSVYEAIYGVLAGCINQFGIKGFALKAIILFLFFLGPVGMLFVFDRQMKAIVRAFRNGFDLTAGFIVSYVGLMVYAMVRYQLGFDMRFFVPLAPFILIVIILITDAGWQSMAGTHMQKPAEGARVISLVTIVALMLFKFYWASPVFSIADTGSEKFLSSDTLNWVTNHLPRETLIATNEPVKLAFFGRYPTLMLPNRTLNPDMYTPYGMRTQVPKRMSQVAAEYLILFISQDVPVKGYLFKEEVGRFRLVYDCPDGAIYRLNE